MTGWYLDQRTPNRIDEARRTVVQSGVVDDGRENETKLTAKPSFSCSAKLRRFERRTCCSAAQRLRSAASQNV